MLIIARTCEAEQTLAGLGRPQLDLVVVAARAEHVLRRVERNSAHRASGESGIHRSTFVLLEAVDHRLQLVIPELDLSVVQRR